MKRAIIILAAIMLIGGCKTIEQSTATHSESTASHKSDSTAISTASILQGERIDSSSITSTDIDIERVIIYYSEPDTAGTQHITSQVTERVTTRSKKTSQAAISDSTIILQYDSSRINKAMDVMQSYRDSTNYHEDADAAQAAATTSLIWIIVGCVVLILVLVAVIILVIKFR